MRDLPAGTVTLIFTDIEGSTRLLRTLGSGGYADALAEHRRILREAFGGHGGVEVDTQGDAFFVAFANAPDAVAAAAQAQSALAGGPTRVRMGLHTGTPAVTGEGYVGEDVHLGARIAGAAQGGQVVVSRATRDLVDRRRSHSTRECGPGPKRQARPGWRRTPSSRRRTWRISWAERSSHRSGPGTAFASAERSATVRRPSTRSRCWQGSRGPPAAPSVQVCCGPRSRPKRRAGRSATGTVIATTEAITFALDQT